MRPSKFRSVRQKLRLTQAELSHLLGVKELTVARWEGGKCRIPNAAAALVEGMRLEAMGKTAPPMRELLFLVRS